MTVLFIGNSHTFVHYVPARFQRFCSERGTPTTAVMLTHPNAGLDWHLNQSQTYFNLMCGGFDAVVLQHSAHPFPGRESLIKAGERLAALTPEGTRLFLYMPWSERDNPAGQALITQAHRELSLRIGAALCPVGQLWWQLRSAHPDSELYFSDGEHASVLGASLAAAVIGRTILGLSLAPEACWSDAQALSQYDLDPRMIDLAPSQDGSFALRPSAGA